MKKDLSDIISQFDCENEKLQHAETHVKQSPSEEKTPYSDFRERKPMVEHFEIEVPVAPNVGAKDMMDICYAYNCLALPSKNEGYFVIRTGHPINFFWLGMNFNKCFNEVKDK